MKPACVQETIWKRTICSSEDGKKKVFNVNSSNIDRPVNPNVDNSKYLSRNNSAEERAKNDAFPSVTVHRLENAKNVTIGALNVNSLSNKIRAVKESLINNIDMFVFRDLN